MATRTLYLYGAYDWALALTVLLYIQTALTFSAISVAWIDLIKTFAISYTFLGFISVIGAALSMVSMLIGGSIVSHIGTRKTLLITIPLLVFSHLLLALAPSQSMLIVVNVGWGLGFGAMLVACTSVVIDWERVRGKRIIDAFQAGWNVASIAGAVLGGYLLSIGWDYRDIMWLAAMSSAPFVVLIGLSAFPRSGAHEESGHPFAGLQLIAGHRTLAIIGALVVITTFAQNIGVSWSPIYLDTLGADPLISGSALAAFQGATALFRLSNGLLVTRFGARAILWCGAVGITFAGVLLYFSTNQYFVLAAFIILGAAVAGAQPTAISLGVKLMPTRTALVSGGILALGEVGFTVSTPMLGWLADQASLQTALATALPCGVLMWIVVFWLPRHQKMSATHSSVS
jgi:MFS family permease